MQRGVIREIDAIGRICFPIEYNKIVGFKVGHNVYFTKSGNGLFITQKDDNLGRNYDKSGRIQLPIEYRNQLTSKEVEISCYDDGVYVGPVGTFRQ